jgi:hypothetical protein
MKLRLIVGACMLVAAGLAAQACGSSDSSVFPGGDGADGGGDNSEGGGTGFGMNEGGTGTGTGTCKPLTCKDLQINCGPAGDGCGGKIDCGTCTAPETCGGGGKPSICGGTAGCVKKTCGDLKIDCGPAGDGCGGEIASCGTCPSPEFCGGGGASKCGGGSVNDAGQFILPDGGACSPRTTCNVNECGPVADGCGGILTCPGCAAGTSCGGGGVASMCGAPACTKTTCALAGANCGYVADGCGGLLDCGGSQANAGCTVGFCGGGGSNKCGTGSTDGGTCTNFCTAQVTCPTPGQYTTITGKVYAPDNALPLPGAVVYVPNGSMTYPYGVTTFTDGVSGGTCDTCNGTASGSPLVNTTSAFDGTFTLQNVPAGVDFPLVIQMGRWRRVLTIPAVTKCTTVAEPAKLTSLPNIQNQGCFDKLGNAITPCSGTGTLDNIPLVSLSTGSVDSLECVFRKLAIADGAGNGNGSGGTVFATKKTWPTQYTVPSGTGRIRFYLDDEAGGTAGENIGAGAPSVTTLMNSQAEMEKYDALIFACPGGESDKVTAARTAAYNYANEGGRVFATHYNYSWLFDVNNNNNTMCDSNFGTATNGCNYTSTWGSTVTWNPDVSSALGKNDTGLVSTTASGGTFDKWLGATGVAALSGTTPDRIGITAARFDAYSPVAAGAELFVSEYNGAAPIPVFHYAFNTPYAAAKQCGRVIFSDFHVSGANTSPATTFPSACGNSALTSQEKVLAYMLFNLTSCITPVTGGGGTCTKISCGAQTCGPASDGCGGQQDCGTCAAGQVCQGSPAKCITPPCTKATCAAGQCGTIPDGCSGTINCGSCATGQICGGGGPNICGSNTCTQTTCMAQNVSCGYAADGCGGILNCGPCPTGQTCGGGGTPGKCGAPMCTPTTCMKVGANCGIIADGCGGSLDCGMCMGSQTCGGSGIPNVCGGGGIH